jgi:hypothetical protein
MVFAAERGVTVFYKKHAVILLIIDKKGIQLETQLARHGDDTLDIRRIKLSPGNP